MRNTLTVVINVVYITTIIHIRCFHSFSTPIQIGHSYFDLSTIRSLKSSLQSTTAENFVDGVGLTSFKAPLYEIDRRRNFAIISHPDAGKTTLTEKLLLFGGAIQDAGAVKARADQRKATSDWVCAGVFTQLALTKLCRKLIQFFITHRWK